MNHDSQVKPVGKVDVRRVQYTKPRSLGIDFYNEIDVWAKMEFKSRRQIDRLRQHGQLDERNGTEQELKPICYAVREKLE